MTHPPSVSRCSRVLVSIPLMKATSFVLLGLSLLCLTGCSTLVNGKHQELTINSNPHGAAYEVDGITGITPGTAKVELGRTDHRVVIRKPGYQPAELKVGRKVNPWLAGNILLVYGFLPGVIVDFVSGAAYELGTDQLQATLQPEYGAPIESPTPQISAKDSPSSKSVAKSE